MSWKDDGAIKRIFNTFNRLKTQIFQQDIDALKQVRASLEYYKKENINNNQLYAVVLALLIKERLRKGQSINTALFMIGNDVRSYTLNDQIHQLTAVINVNELSQFMDEKKVNVPKGKNIFEDTDELLEIWHKEYDKEFLQKILDSWTYEEVSDSFYNTANELLKDFEPAWNNKK